MNVIKEGGGTPSYNPPLPSSRCTYSRYGKYRVGELSSWRCKRELYLRKRDNGGCGRTSELGVGAGGAAKDFVVSRTFYSVSSGWRLLSASQRTNSSSPSSSSLSIPLSSGLCPSPLLLIPFSRPVLFSQSIQ